MLIVIAVFSYYPRLHAQQYDSAEGQKIHMSTVLVAGAHYAR